jgi:signal transduction histidine kinase
LEILATQDAEGARVRRVVFSDITERKKNDEKIQALSQSLIQAQERERCLISCELHDSIAQNLSALKINNDLIYTDMPMTFPDLRKKLAVSSSLIVQTIVAVRNLAYDLRLPGLEEMGLLKALEIYCEEASEKGNVKFDFQSSGMSAIDLDRDVEIHIYRLIQECINNIRKHADADHATILVLGSSPNIILHIRDNGRGFDVKAQELLSAATKRMGIRGMQERVSMIHGSMIINSQPMEGAHISIKIPLQKNLSGNPEKHKSSIKPLPKIYSE